MEWSRIAIIARPVRLSSRLRAIQNIRTAMASTTRYIHWSALSGRPKGGSGLKMLMPCTPLVNGSKWRYFRICGTATASAKVASAR